MDFDVTHQSAVDAWECDQMEHLNVRFYGARFSEAEAYFFARAGLPQRPAVEEHLQLRHEIRRGAAIRIESGGQGLTGSVHRLFDSDRDLCCATLDVRYAPSDMPTSRFLGEGWSLCGMRLLGRHHDGATGLTREALLGLAHHAAIHLGLDRHKPRDATGRLLAGTAVVACHLRRFGHAIAETRLVIYSRVHGCGRTSVRLQHRLVDEATDAAVAEIEVTSVFFDMQTRRPCPVPDALRSAVAISALPTT